MQEVWKDIKGFEGLYQISNMGRVKNIRNDKEKYLFPATKEYSVRLTSCKKEQLIPIHRLVAQAFIPNPEAKHFVKHINRIKSDNRVSNLYWTNLSH